MTLRCFFVILFLMPGFTVFGKPRFSEQIPWDRITVPYRDSIEALFTKPDVKVEMKNIRFHTSQDTLDQLLAELELSGDLWRGYQFMPPYIIKRIGATRFAVTERQYLGGTVDIVYQAPGHCIYFTRGFVQSKFLGATMLTLEGTGLVVTQYVPVDDGIRGQIHVYSRIDQTLLSMAVRILQPVLHTYVMKHTENAINKARKISEDVTAHPDEPRWKLSGLRPQTRLLGLYDTLFMKQPPSAKVEK